jgi:positive regulator of sigma E activity
MYVSRTNDSLIIYLVVAIALFVAGVAVVTLNFDNFQIRSFGVFLGMFSAYSARLYATRKRKKY